MSRCARCGWKSAEHTSVTDAAGFAWRGRGCHRFTPPDPWWIRILARARRPLQ